MKSVASLNLFYYFAQINETTLRMIEEFDEELIKYNGSKINVTNLKSAGDITDTVTKSVTDSIMSSKSSSMNATAGKRMRSKLMSSKGIIWSIPELKRYKVKLYQAKRQGFKLDELAMGDIVYEKSEVELYVAVSPFAAGALRYAFACYLNVDPSNRDQSKFIKSVIKQSKFADEKYNTLKYMKESIESHIVSDYLAKEFNKISPSKKSIRFVGINIVKIEETGELYSIEDYFDGRFEKWSNNAGFINEDSYSATLDAFAHWSYQATNQYLVVTDLQGCHAGTEYVLTDPAVTCPADFDRFSLTNLGKQGLKEFFVSHRCNHICKKLGLKKHKYQTQPDRLLSSSMTQLK